MKKLILAVALLALVSCKKESEESFGKSVETETTTETASKPESAATLSAAAVLGKEVFEGKGNCVSCHQLDKKVIGPSAKEIAQIYKEKNGNMVSFLKGEADAIVDPSQFAVMQTNLALTKTFSDAELQGLEAYINSSL